MNKDQVEGRVDQAKGKVKEVAGKVLGSDKLEAEGEGGKADLISGGLGGGVLGYALGGDMKTAGIFGAGGAGLAAGAHPWLGAARLAFRGGRVRVHGHRPAVAGTRSGAQATARR